jgi:ketosteroid isomerase-like protein
MEVVRQALEAIGRRDLSAILERVDAEVELHPLLSVWPQTYRGREGIEQWWRDVGELWEDFEVETEGFHEVGNETLVVRLHWRGRARGGATEVDGPAAAVVRFRGAKVAFVDIHLDEAHALRAIADT